MNVEETVTEKPQRLSSAQRSSETSIQVMTIQLGQISHLPSSSGCSLLKVCLNQTSGMLKSTPQLW